MKKQLLLPITLLFATFLPAQTIKNSPLPSVDSSSEKSFFEIRKSFQDYWAPYHVNNGYYNVNGVKTKAAGWKQFKRWEWYWENRIDPKTGSFPKTNKADIYQKIKRQRGVTSSGGNWSSLGPSSSSGGYAGIGRINCVAFRSGDNGTYYAGSPSGGLWKTTDDGATWTPLTDANAVLGVSDAVVIAGTTTASDVVYIATGDRDGGSMWSLGGNQIHDNNSIGVLKSIDGGSSWASTGLTFTVNQKITVNHLLMDTNNNDILYAATSNGLYKTTDGGVSWSILTANQYWDIEFKPGDSQVIYGATRVGYIYLSTDAGATWTAVLNDYSAGGRRIELAVSSNQSTWVYAVEANTSGALFAVYKSINSGSSFSKVYDGSSSNHNLLGWATDETGTTGQGSYDLALAALPSDANTVYLGGVITFKSTDGGSTWNAVNCWTGYSGYNKNGAPVVHADKHILKFRNSDNYLFETNDGGIYYTTDGGSTWTDKTNGIVPSQIYRLGIAKSSSSEVITGLQDNGSKLLSGGTWNDELGGDGMECLIDFTTLNTQFAETPNGDISRTTNHWTSSTSITQDNSGNPINGLNETGYWVTPYVIDPVDHQTLYLGLNNIWKSADQGSSWTKISTMSSSDKIRSIAVAPSNSQVIYAADPSHIWATTTGGTSWSDITGTLPVSSSYITYVSVKNDDASTAWVSMGEYNAYGVFETTDGGTTWTDISSGLPSIPVMCVIQNRQETSLNELYAGTDVGVYVKRSTGNWTAFNTGLPNVVVPELEIYYDNSQPALSKLRAATYGRGLWESDLYSPPNSPPVAEFSANIRIPTTNQTVAFTDLSTNSPTSWLWSFTPSTVTYQNGSSSTTQNPEVQFTATGTYQVQLAATNSHGSDSTVKSEYIKVANYCAAQGGGTIFIDHVIIGTIDNSGTGDNGYTDYNNLSTQLSVGSSNTLTVHFGFAYLNDTVVCWVDWNQDGDFTDSNEECFYIDIGSYTEYGTITVPDDAVLGFTRMRIRNKHSGPAYSPCGTTTWGEVEDYAIEVKSAPTSWTGTTNQWNVASNWSTGVIPTMSYDVTIPLSPSGGNFPVIPVGYTAKCNKITLETGATITINGTLQVNQ